MGLLPEDELTIAENINNLATQAETIDLTTQNQVFAYETRMDFAKMESQKKLQNLAIQANKVAYLPSVFMYANAGTSVGTINFGDAWLPKNWYGFFSIGLSIQIPIFDGFQKSYIGQQHSLSLQKTENILGQMKRLIDFEQRQAKVTLHNALASLKNQEKNKALATEVLKITKIKYKEGTNSNTEVLLAESAYREAENNYFSALFEVLLAKIEVEKVSGKI
jgi:outer membrane protein TolC